MSDQDVPLPYERAERLAAIRSRFSEGDVASMTVMRNWFEGIEDQVPAARSHRDQIIALFRESMDQIGMTEDDLYGMWLGAITVLSAMEIGESPHNSGAHIADAIHRILEFDR